MKKSIISRILVLAFGLLMPQITQAQGTIYISNLGQTATSSRAVRSDSWLWVRSQHSGESKAVLVALINSRSDETWLPEWSGNLGGVQRCAVRSRGVSWGKPVFRLTGLSVGRKSGLWAGAISARR